MNESHDTLTTTTTPVPVQGASLQPQCVLTMIQEVVTNQKTIKKHQHLESLDHSSYKLSNLVPSTDIWKENNLWYFKAPHKL